MGLGVLDVANHEHVPGTAFVLDDPSRPTVSTTNIDSRLKYDLSGPEPIILVPQPSDDPNDPLNWPLWKRDVMLCILSFIALIASTFSSLFAANTITLSLWFQRDFTAIALLTGYVLCGTGVAGVVFVASARVWGKRHLYILGTILVIVGSAWGGASGHNYQSLLWARIIQGVGLAPFEALVNASVGDLYFVHERGKRMALSNLALFGGAFFTPIIVGKITHSLGWQWSLNFIAIFTGVAFPLVFFFVPETAYRRAYHSSIDHAGQTISLPKLHAGHSAGETSNPTTPPHSGGTPNGSVPTSFEKHRGDLEGRTLTSHEPIPEKDSFARNLRLFNGRKTDENFFKLLLRPFPLFLHPAIVWGCLIQGTLIGWTVMIGVVLAIILLSPPLFFDEVATGYMYTGPFIGAMLGFIVSGLLSDSSTRFMIRRNKGVYEPEFRIVLVVAQLLFGCVGLYGFGITANDIPRYGPFLPDFFFGMEVMGLVFGAVASALYIVDAHAEIAVEAFTCMLIFKNMFSFGLTWIGYNWILRDGIFKLFITMATVQVVICLLSVPMYIFGKRNRSFMRKHDILKITRLY